MNSQFTSSLDIPELFNVAVATKLLQGSRCFLRFDFWLFDPLRSQPIVMSLGQILESADRPLFQGWAANHSVMS